MKHWLSPFVPHFTNLSYLSFGDEQPLWPFATDSHHAQSADNNISLEVTVNMFLQTWDTKVTVIKLYLASMVKAAMDNDLQLDGLFYWGTLILRETPRLKGVLFGNPDSKGFFHRPLSKTGDTVG
jgi:hypothetical protein